MMAAAEMADYRLSNEAMAWWISSASGVKVRKFFTKSFIAHAF